MLQNANNVKQNSAFGMLFSIQELAHIKEIVNDQLRQAVGETFDQSDQVAVDGSSAAHGLLQSGDLFEILLSQHHQPPHHDLHAQHILGAVLFQQLILHLLGDLLMLRSKPRP